MEYKKGNSVITNILIIFLIILIVVGTWFLISKQIKSFNNKTNNSEQNNNVNNDNNNQDDNISNSNQEDNDEKDIYEKYKNIEWASNTTNLFDDSIEIVNGKLSSETCNDIIQKVEEVMIGIPKKVVLYRAACVRTIVVLTDENKVYVYIDEKENKVLNVLNDYKIVDMTIPLPNYIGYDSGVGCYSGLSVYFLTSDGQLLSMGGGKYEDINQNFIGYYGEPYYLNGIYYDNEFNLYSKTNAHVYKNIYNTDGKNLIGKFIYMTYGDGNQAYGYQKVVNGYVVIDDNDELYTLNFDEQTETFISNHIGKYKSVSYEALNEEEYKVIFVLDDDNKYEIMTKEKKYRDVQLNKDVNFYE